MDSNSARVSFWPVSSLRLILSTVFLVGEESFEGTTGFDLESEAFGARFGDTFADPIVGVVVKPLGDLIDLVFSEAGECALFSHKV
jgi:hypothetical protein